MMLDRMEGNAELKTSVHQMLTSRRLTHSVLLVGEEGLGAGFAARCRRLSLPGWWCPCRGPAAGRMLPRCGQGRQT
jgi:hypothetical protein